jgi:hypothetical protein
MLCCVFIVDAQSWVSREKAAMRTIAITLGILVILGSSSAAFGDVKVWTFNKNGCATVATAYYKQIAALKAALVAAQTAAAKANEPGKVASWFDAAKKAFDGLTKALLNAFCDQGLKSSDSSSAGD